MIHSTLLRCSLLLLSIPSPSGFSIALFTHHTDQLSMLYMLRSCSDIPVIHHFSITKLQSGQSQRIAWAQTNTMIQPKATDEVRSTPLSSCFLVSTTIHLPLHWMSLWYPQWKWHQLTCSYRTTTNHEPRPSLSTWQNNYDSYNYHLHQKRDVEHLQQACASS